MSNLNEALAAGQSKRFAMPADFVRLMNTTGAVEIVYYRAGGEVARTGSVQAGYAERFRQPFDYFIVTDKSGAANNFELVYRNGADVRYDRGAGNVSVVGGVALSAPVRASGTQAQKTVTNASAQLLAANANRNYLLIQNNDTAGNLFINLVGAAAAAGSGIKIAPGGSFEMANQQLTGQINAIGDIASNANVVVVEG